MLFFLPKPVANIPTAESKEYRHAHYGGTTKVISDRWPVEWRNYSAGVANIGLVSLIYTLDLEWAQMPKLWSNDTFSVSEKALPVKFTQLSRPLDFSDIAVRQKYFSGEYLVSHRVMGHERHDGCCLGWLKPHDL